MQVQVYQPGVSGLRFGKVVHSYELTKWQKRNLTVTGTCPGIPSAGSWTVMHKYGFPEYYERKRLEKLYALCGV